MSIHIQISNNQCIIFEYFNILKYPWYTEKAEFHLKAEEDPLVQTMKNIFELKIPKKVFDFFVFWMGTEEYSYSWIYLTLHVREGALFTPPPSINKHVFLQRKHGLIFCWTELGQPQIHYRLQSLAFAGIVHKSMFIHLSILHLVSLLHLYTY